MSYSVSLAALLQSAATPADLAAGLGAAAAAGTLENSLALLDAAMEAEGIKDVLLDEAKLLRVRWRLGKVPLFGSKKEVRKIIEAALIPNFNPAPLPAAVRASFGAAPPLSPHARQAAAGQKRTMAAHPPDLFRVLDNMGHWDPRRRLDAVKQLQRIHRRSEEKRPELEGALLGKIGLEQNRKARQKMIRIYRAMRRLSQTGRAKGYQARSRNVVDLQGLMAAAHRVLAGLPEAERSHISLCDLTRRIALDYNRHLPNTSPPLSPSTFYRHVSGDRVRKEIIELFDRAGIIKTPHVPIDREGVRRAAFLAISQLKAERSEERQIDKIAQGAVIRCAYAIYCNSLAESKRPRYSGFKVHFLERPGNTSLLELLKQQGVVKQSRVLLQNSSAASRALDQAFKELGPQARPYPIARRAYQIYLEQNPAGRHPSLQAFRRLYERTRKNIRT